MSEIRSLTWNDVRRSRQHLDGRGGSVSEIRSLTWNDVDNSATLAVEESMSPGKCVAILGFAPVETGFGKRLHVPLSDAQIDDETRDPGSFLELTYGQAMDLSAKLATLLAKSVREG